MPELLGGSGGDPSGGTAPAPNATYGSATLIPVYGGSGGGGGSDAAANGGWPVAGTTWERHFSSPTLR